MIEKGKISSFQMAFVMYPTVMATAILILPSITGAHAKRDMWLSPVWACVIGLFTLFIAYRLNKRYPEKTLIEYCESILGRYAGKLLGLVFLLFYLHLGGIIVREYGEFIVVAFLNRTPLVVVMVTLLLVCAMNVRGGLEVIGRSAQMFVPIVLLLFVTFVILLSPDLEPRNMLPILEHGPGPSFMGSLVAQGWFSEFLLVSFMLPYVSDKHKGMKWGIVSVLMIMLTMVVTNIASLFLLGNSAYIFTYPVMVAARFITIGEFFEHLEAVVMAIWVMGTFIKMSVFYYAVVLGTAQWLKLSDYRPLTLPIGFLLLILGIWVSPNLQEMVHFLSTVSPFYFMSVQTLIPTLLLIIAYIRFKVQHRKGALGE